MMFTVSDEMESMNLFYKHLKLECQLRRRHIRIIFEGIEGSGHDFNPNFVKCNNEPSEKKQIKHNEDEEEWHKVTKQKTYYCSR